MTKYEAEFERLWADSVAIRPQRLAGA